MVRTPGCSLVDGERLESNAAALRKEYLELFRRARSRKQLVPGPQKILLDLGELLSRVPRQGGLSRASRGDAGG